MSTAIVILAGGTGTRLWPLSRNKSPKQFNAILNEKTLLRNSFDRLLNQYDAKDIFISTNTSFHDLVLSELPEVPKDNYILEPKKMDRTAAFGLISLVVKDRGYDNIILVACDDHIGNVEEFLRVLKVSEDIITENLNQLLLIGMSPTYAATGYGYIEMGEPFTRNGKDIVFKVQSFKEKPDQRKAEKFVSEWKYLWNSGWFVYNLDFMIDKYKELAPDTLEHLKKCYKLDPHSKEFLDEFSKCEEITFDIAIVEKLQDVIVLPASVDWSDIGSWKLVRDIQTNEDDLNQNIFNTKDVTALDTEGTIVHSTHTNKKIAVIGLKNVAIIDTPDVLLVTTIDRAQDVKKIVEMMPEELQ